MDLLGVTQGFELCADGTASSINMATLSYESWERSGDTLLLRGQSIGNGQTLSFIDTLLVERCTTDSLVVQRGILTRKFCRPCEP